MSQEIAPCPFCGSEAEYEEELGAILCSGCGFMYNVNGPLEEEIKNWNLRAPCPDCRRKEKIIEAAIPLKKFSQTAEDEANWAHWYSVRPALSPAPASEEGKAKPLTEDDVEWIVNDIAELGVKIGDQFFFLYKGASYMGGEKWRPVFKREFGECCHPWGAIKRKWGEERLPNSYVGFLGEDIDDWKPLPSLPSSESKREELSPEDQADIDRAWKAMVRSEPAASAEEPKDHPAPISDEDERRICWSCHADKAGCRVYANGCCPDCDHWKPAESGETKEGA